MKCCENEDYDSEHSFSWSLFITILSAFWFLSVSLYHNVIHSDTDIHITMNSKYVIYLEEISKLYGKFILYWIYLLYDRLSKITQDILKSQYVVT